MVTLQSVVSMLAIGVLFIRENWRLFAVELFFNALIARFYRFHMHLLHERGTVHVRE